MASERRPNVVVCLVDQLRAFEVGCYGNEVVRTPNIDRIAEGGVRFELACSNNPVCTPSRSSLLSGQYGRTCTGALGNCGEPVKDRVQLPDCTMAEAFKNAGYTTGLIGKWHIAVDPTLLGFDTALYPLVMHRYTGQTFVRSNGEPFTTDRWAPRVEQEELTRWLGQRGDEPFFLFYNISQPHMPLDDMPVQYKNMYSRDDVPLRGNTSEDGDPEEIERWFRTYLWDFLYYDQHLPHTERRLRDFDLRALTALYYGATSWADDQLGGLIRALEDNLLLQDTLLVFLSDHGDNLGSHGLFNKDVLYDESIRIPMIFHWPAGLGARVVGSQVASLVDVMPTLLPLANVDTPGSVQGADLSGVVRGEQESVGSNAAFIETSGMMAGVRTATHLFGVQMAEGPDGKPHMTAEDAMFFDLASDPLEEFNLVGTGLESSLEMELKLAVADWDVNTPWMAAK